MNEAVATILMGGIIQLAAMVLGYLKLRDQARITANKAAEAVGKAEELGTKIEENTSATNAVVKAVETKADTIVKQTNGKMDATHDLVKELLDRVSKLEAYNHERSHDILNVVGAQSNKLNVLLEKAGVDTTEDKK